MTEILENKENTLDALNKCKERKEISNASNLPFI
jgi:hypothetical protein